jgi:uncharacterized protein YecE (DUF72 family)
MDIDIAAYGWQGREWEHFYPDDLPADWRLDYYANEFLALLVPHHEWSVQGDNELLAWQQQVSDEFRFYWEVPSDAVEASLRLQRLLIEGEFAAHWGGVVDFSAVSPLNQSPSSEKSLTLLRLQQPMELRPLRRKMEEAMVLGGSRLLVIVEAAAADSLRPARDVALLLGGG